MPLLVKNNNRIGRFNNITTMNEMHHEYYWGMNWIWWVLWFIFIIWIFITPYDIPGQRSRKETALDILKKRLAKGEIDIHEYEEKKAILKKD